MKRVLLRAGADQLGSWGLPFLMPRGDRPGPGSYFNFLDRGTRGPHWSPLPKDEVT